MNATDDWPVTIAIPYFQCKAQIGQVVASILSQTHTNLTLVVVNDGDPTPPWSALDQIHDRRLVRFDLPENRGPFFANATVLAATDAPYFTVQDADDWSEPQRIALLLDKLRTDQADGALSAGYRHKSEHGLDFVTQYDSFPGRGKLLTERFQHRAMHQCLFRTESLRRIGGYHGGFRIAYDTLLTNLILMTGKLAYVDQPLYHRRVRPGSLTMSQATGFGSLARLETVRRLRQLYRQAFETYSSYLTGAIDAVTLAGSIHQLCTANVPEEERHALQREANRLRAILSTA